MSWPTLQNSNITHTVARPAWLSSNGLNGIKTEKYK